MKTRGLVDGDRTENADKDALQGRSVHSLESCAVESLYYHPRVQREVAGPRCRREGGNLEERLDAAAQRTICVHDRLKTEDRITRPSESSDRDFAEAIIMQVAIKKTDIPQQIAQALGFGRRREYENAVLDRVGEDEAFGQKIIGLDKGLAGLASDLQASPPGWTEAGHVGTSAHPRDYGPPVLTPLSDFACTSCRTHAHPMTKSGQPGLGHRPPLVPTHPAAMRLLRHRHGLPPTHITGRCRQRRLTASDDRFRHI